MNAVGLSAVGIAVAAPDLWPSIVAVAASICVVAVMGGAAEAVVHDLVRLG